MKMINRKTKIYLLVLLATLFALPIAAQQAGDEFEDQEYDIAEVAGDSTGWYISGAFQGWLNFDTDYELSATDDPYVFKIELPIIYGEFLIEHDLSGDAEEVEWLRSNGSNVKVGIPYNYVIWTAPVGVDHLYIDGYVSNAVVTIDLYRETLLIEGDYAPFGNVEHLYIIGSPAGAWSPSVGIEMERVGNSLYSWTGDMTKGEYFGFTTTLGSDWAIVNNNRFSPETDGTLVNINSSNRMYAVSDYFEYSNNAWQMSDSGKFKILVDVDKLTFTVTKAVTEGPQAGDEFEYEGLWYTVMESSNKTVTFDFVNEDYGLERRSGSKDEYSNDGETIEYEGVKLLFTSSLGEDSKNGAGSRLWTDGIRVYIGGQIIISVDRGRILDVSYEERESTSNLVYSEDPEDGTCTISYTRNGSNHATIQTLTVVYTLVPQNVKEGLKCSTRSGNSDSPGNTYSGNLFIPEKVYNEGIEFDVTEIGRYGFSNNEDLTSVSLTNTVDVIRDFAFAGCSGLTQVTYLAEIPVKANQNCFDTSIYEAARLSMPNATLGDIAAVTPWNLFKNVVAKDGTLGDVTEGPQVGDEFEYEGLWYTVTDAAAMTCETRGGSAGVGGNDASGDVTVPERVSDGKFEFAVTGVGAYGFRGSSDLLSITLPATVESVGAKAFADCPRLTSFVWKAKRRLSGEVTTAIGNPNLLLYVDNPELAPEAMTGNVVVTDAESGEQECEYLVVEQGHAFRAALPFTALHSTMTKEFRQNTPIDGCEGWETIVLPFDVKSVSDSRGELTPFGLVTDILTEYPYWLYEADSRGDWKVAFGIMAGVPYIISMPNNDEYESRYNIEGPVTFSNDTPVRITSGTSAPYAVTWPTGCEMRSLWLPLAADEVYGAMGLNVGMSDLTDDNGQNLAPGSAFCAGVEPKPLEAYVTRSGAERTMHINRGQSHVLTVGADDSLRVEVSAEGVTIYSGTDRHVDLFSADGVRVAACEVKAGEPCRVDGLEKGIYIVAGRKVVIKN